MSEQGNSIEHWWATTGGVPVRDVPRLAFLIDGRMTMLEMCLAFLRARHSIYITAWGLSPELLLVRGKHKSAGAAGSVEQEELLSWLRAKGLEEEELLFWQQSDELSVLSVLEHAVNKEVDVKILLWDTYKFPFQPQPSPKKVQETLAASGICCLLDDSHMGLLKHPMMAHHQKTAVVDSRLAFVGGIDMMVENDGDYDRWDTKGHHYHTPLRLGKDGTVPHSWHDVHVMFEGAAVADVEHNFRQRWNAVVQLHELKPSLILLEEMPALPTNSKSSRFPGMDSTVRLQVTRTIPKEVYTFTPEEGISTILQTYKRAFANAKRFIYIEIQYLGRRTFMGFENPALGLPHPEMDELFHTLAGALARGVVVTLLLPDNPNVGREFTDEGLNYLWELAPHAVSTGALQAYTLGSSFQDQDRTLYHSVYVHAKTTIVDDVWITLGSANLNNRGMLNDTEMNVAIMHPELAHRLRVFLMAEHLYLCHEDNLFQILDALGETQVLKSTRRTAAYIRSLGHWLRSQWRVNSTPTVPTYALPPMKRITGELRAHWEELQTQLADPFNGLALFAQQAKDNLEAVKAGQPLVGHMLPYIPYSRAQDYGVGVHAVNGWLDSIPNSQIEDTTTA